MRGKVSALVTRHCTDDLENRKPCHGGNQVFLDFDWNSTSQKRLLPRTHHVDRPRRSAAKSKSKQTKASANKMDTAKIGATHHATMEQVATEAVQVINISLFCHSSAKSTIAGQ